MAREGRGVDRADHRHFQRVARQRFAPHIEEIFARHGVDLAQFTARRARIGMPRPGGAPPGLGRHAVGLRGFALQHGVDLGAHPGEGRFVESRRVERQRQKLERLVGVARQGLKMAGEFVALGGKAEADGVIVERAMEGFRFEIAGALVEQAGEKRRGAGLALRILGSATGEGKIHRDQGHGVILDQPGGDPAGADDMLDPLGARDSCCGSVHGGISFDAHAARSLSRNPETARRLLSHCIALATSSAVTASIRAAQPSTSRTLPPLARAAPNQRASETWLSWA